MSELASRFRETTGVARVPGLIPASRRGLARRSPHLPAPAALAPSAAAWAGSVPRLERRRED
jgi:hypothetical protein